MKCSVCQSPLQYKGGENKEDYGCANRDCRRFDIHYYGNVKVRNGWYFLAGYHLPFEYIDVHWRSPDYTYKWYSLVGDGFQTHLQGLKLVERSYGTGKGVWNEATQDYRASTWKECVQETLHSIPYYALPANNDFSHQFGLLRDMMMEEWFSLYDPKKTKNEDNDPRFYSNPFPFDWQDYFYSGQRTINIPSPNALVIEPKLKALIELAANNTNHNEASNAAIEACKRLRKLIKE